MQATLLAVGIAIILALFAALVGPYFVDWGQYRSVFETEASRLTGVPIRVGGEMDVRVLPTPSLVLHDIEAGPAGGEQRLRARELSVELALAPLLRGQFQAAEARLVGLELRLGLDAGGKVAWPVSLQGIDPDQLSIRRLVVEDGRAVLDEAASGTRVVVDKIAFRGELRSFAGPIKGDGRFAVEGRRYDFKISAGRLDAAATMKVKLALNPADRPWTVETDGTLGLPDGVPEFDGTLTLARSAGAVDASGRGAAFVPWRTTGQVKANPAGMLVQAFEYQYGSDERAAKLSGTANLTFGKSPRFDAAIAGRQFDLDAVLDLPAPSSRQPVAAMRKLSETLLDPFKPPIPGKVGISIDVLTLAGGPLQAVRVDLAFDDKGWDLDTFEFRAPGAARVHASGRLTSSPDGVDFNGPAAVEAGDLMTLLAWLEVRPAPSPGQSGMFKAGGDVTLRSDRIAIDHLKAEIDRKVIEGRLAYTPAAGRHPARLEAELKAGALDIDELKAFVDAARAGTKGDWPAEVALSAEIGEATIAGIAARDARAQLTLDANGLVLERLSVADLGGAALSASGRIDALRNAPRGTLTLDLDAHALDGTLALLAKLAPRAADAVAPIAARLAPLKGRALLTMSGAGTTADATASKLDIQATAGRVKLQLTAETTGDPWDLDALALKLNGQASADNGAALTALLGLDGLAVADRSPATLTVVAEGPMGGDLRVNASLAAAGLTAGVKGTTRVFGADGPTAGFALTASAEDIGPALRAAGTRPASKLPAAATARVTAAPGKISFDDLAGTVAGAPIHGRLTVMLDPAPRIDAHVIGDDFYVPALMATVIGVPPQAPGRSEPGNPSAEPFAAGLFGKLSGQIELNASRAALTSSLTARNAHGVLRFGENEIVLENVEAELIGGRLRGEVAFRRTLEGLSAKAKLSLVNVEATGLLPARERPAVNGRLSLQAELQGTGHSPAALLGSLSGIGAVSLDQARLARLDPKAFDAAARAVDQGLAIDPGSIRDAVAPALDAGDLSISHAEGALTITSGRARVINLIAHGEGADLAVTGDINLSEWTVDARMTLTGPATGSNLRPDIMLALAGPVAAANRTIDASALANWLLLRSLDREASKVEALGSDRRDSADQKRGPLMPSTPQSLPPPPGASTQSQPGPVSPLRRKPGRSEVTIQPIEPAPAPAPALPPAIELRPVPAPGVDRMPSRPKQRAAGDTAPPAQPGGSPPQPAAPPSDIRSFLERLFGSQR